MTVEVGPGPVGWYAVIPSLPLVGYGSELDAAITRLCDLLELLSPPTPTLH